MWETFHRMHRSTWMGIMFDILLPLLLFFVRDLGTLSWRIFEMRRHFTFEGANLRFHAPYLLKLSKRDASSRKKSFSVTHVHAATFAFHLA